jgi:hypothetical protein
MSTSGELLPALKGQWGVLSGGRNSPVTRLPPPSASARLWLPPEQPSDDGAEEKE